MYWQGEWQCLYELLDPHPVSCTTASIAMCEHQSAAGYDVTP